MRSIVAATVLALASGCEGDAPVAGSTCAATTAVLSPFGDLEQARATVADITGDGADDVVTIAADGDGYRLALDGGATIALGDDATFLATLAVVDLDGDGAGDLAVGSPWLNRVLVFAGPIAGALDPADARLTLVGPPIDGGLAPLYGTAVAVLDADGDGARDVVVTSPAEREEGCLGQRPPRLYLGPFPAGAVRDEADVALELTGPMRGCLGEQITCAADALGLSAVGGAVCYPLPLTVDEPPRCAAP